MKKVLIIIGKLSIGGAERVGRDIGVFADHEQFDIHYLVFEKDIGPYEADVKATGCRVIHVDSPSRGYGRFFRTLMQLIRTEHYDVIHAHTMLNSGWAMLAGKLCGVPIRITHSHSIRSFEKRSFLKTLYERCMRCLILLFSTDLVACGVCSGEWLFGKRAFSERGKLIYNGIDLDAFAFDAAERAIIREQLGLQDAFVVGHVGHLAQVKNQKFLIELLPKILHRKPNAALLMLGDGQDRAMLEERIRELGLSDRVIMTGNVRNVSDYLNAMDVFAFPSLFEGMPLSIVEVQANGLPCILSTGVPHDVYLTDLVQPLPLDCSDLWIDSICNSRRGESRKYAEYLKQSGFDSSEIMKKYYELYERADRN